tara:strand:+ start:2921 stop:3913 length:993 start_codon:yes stop_codon:yes gene_type:complete
MNSHLETLIRQATQAKTIHKTEEIQSLWSGYGDISRYQLTGCERKSVVVKHVQLPDEVNHPRGWHSDLSHQRKIRSYQVESAWYRFFAELCDQHCRVPEYLALEERKNKYLIVLEDLNECGFSERKDSTSIKEMKVCLSWLANFHATFMGKKTISLWEVGTYWHLATRPDELEALSDLPLKLAAAQIDQALQDCPYQTLVHGDAKLANFCFSTDGQQVAAVDFQYVGGGAGIKDVAYFIGSCLNEEACEIHESELLDFYFEELQKALNIRQNDIDPQAVEDAWRVLFPLAWTDFHRFIKGWSPGHWKIHSYSERLAHQVIDELTLSNKLK